MTPAITVEAGVSPALFWDSQPARLPLQLASKRLLRKKSEKHKNVATRRVPIPIPWTDNPNNLTGQNLNEPQNQIYY
jgi:hypothetical protein